MSSSSRRPNASCSARRPDRLGRGRAKGARSRAARQFRQAARRAQAVRRPHLARVVFVSYGHPALAAPNTPAPADATVSTCIRPSLPTASGCARRWISSPTGSCPGSRRLPAARTASSAATRRRAHDLRRRPSGGFAAHRRLRALRQRSGLRSGMLFGDGETFRAEPACGDRPAGLRLRRERISPLRLARTLDPHRKRQLLHRDDLSRGLPSLLQPTDLHDATWGVFAAVYGGAVHPTAEGHAAMADAALPAVREVLGLQAPAAPVRREPLPPPQKSTLRRTCRCSRGRMGT